MSPAALSTFDNFTISGTCDQFDEATDCVDNASNEIQVAYDGTLQGSVDTTVDGAWSITGNSTPSTGTIITVFVATTTNEHEAVAITKYDGSGDIIWHHII